VLVSSCLRRFGGFVAFSLALALAAAPSAVAALSAGYSPQPADGVDLPNRQSGDGGFGTTMTSLDGLLLVGVPGASNGEGAVVLIGPGGGEPDRINPPLEPSHIGAPTGFGASVAAIPDIGKCATPASKGSSCPASPIRDGVTDFLVGAPGADIRNGAGVDMGIVYVYDGATRAFMKRIQFARATAPDPIPGAPLAGDPDFGASVSSLSGRPPCLGAGGMTACPGDDRVTQGDVDGDGVPDIAIGAPLYRESADSSVVCMAPPGETCPATGRVYVVKGSDVTQAGDVLALSDEDHLVYLLPTSYPYSDPDTGETPKFGGSIMPLGDLGSCDTTDVLGALCPADHVRSAQDGVPDLLISGTGVDAGATDAGAAFVLDGFSGTILYRIQSPAPASGALFGSFSSGQRAFGDLIDTPLPDIYVGAAGVGRGFVFTGDSSFPIESRLWADTSVRGAGFGASSAPAGNIGGDAPGEVLIGDTGSGAAHVFSACGNAIVQSIGAPAGAGGFGASVVSVGDVNHDGYPDFAVGAPSAAGGAGRVFVMTSNGAPGPAVPACNPSGGGGGGGTAAGGAGSSSPPKTSPGKKTRTLAIRRISFTASKKKVKAGKPVRFRGRVRAAKRKATCQRRQKVAIQRSWRLGSKTGWTTIDVAVTNRKGKFLATTTPYPGDTTYTYRARVNRTKRCAAALSNRVKVRAT
jgi:hypothetical protein